MKKLLILSLCYFQATYADDYFSYLEKLSRPHGNFREGEIEIVVDPVEISRIQQIQENRLLQKGFSSEEAKKFSQVGIVGEDHHWIWLRDAVYFPEGVTGTYDRLVGKRELIARPVGVAVLPILPSGEIGLILTYRHATRSWELEIPRGGIELGETNEEAALREVQEETGFTASSLSFLGEIATDSGIHSMTVPVFLAKISSQGESSPEDSEAIAGVILLTKEEVKAGLVQGFLEVTVQGQKKEVPLRDGFLTFALLQAELRQL